MVTVFYRIFGEDSYDGSDGLPNAFEAKLNADGTFTLRDLLLQFPPSKSCGVTRHFHFSTVSGDGSSVDIPWSPESIVPVSKDRSGNYYNLEAVPLAAEPRFSKIGTEEERTRIRNGHHGAGRDSWRSRNSGDVVLGMGGTAALQSVNHFVEIGSGALGSILHAVGNAVTKASESLNINSEITIDHRPYRIIREIAEGGFGKVFLVREQITKLDFAMKQINCSSAAAVMDAESEVNKLKELRHENIIDLVGSAVFSNQKQKIREYYLVFPYFPRGTVWDAISQPSHGSTFTPISEKEALRVFLGCCEGLLAMHRSNYAHWDVKPMNILLSEDGKPILMDLGSACQKKRTPNTRQDAMLIQDEAASKSSSDYRAPELTSCCKDLTVDERVDVWSLGCTLYAMAFGHSPFFSPKEGVMTLAILNGRFSFPANHGYSSGFCSLIQRCIVVNPDERPFVPEVIRVAQGCLYD